jgi:hypothetical protein
LAEEDTWTRWIFILLLLSLALFCKILLFRRKWLKGLPFAQKFTPVNTLDVQEIYANQCWKCFLKPKGTWAWDDFGTSQFPPLLAFQHSSRLLCVDGTYKLTSGGYPCLVRQDY